MPFQTGFFPTFHSGLLACPVWPPSASVLTPFDWPEPNELQRNAEGNNCSQSSSPVRLRHSQETVKNPERRPILTELFLYEDETSAAQRRDEGKRREGVVCVTSSKTSVQGGLVSSRNRHHHNCLAVWWYFSQFKLYLNCPSRPPVNANRLCDANAFSSGSQNLSSPATYIDMMHFPSVERSVLRCIWRTAFRFRAVEL